MLSLDTRMVGLHVHPDSELAPTRSVSSNALLQMMSGYSPITPVNLKAAFDYEASILSESAMLRIDSYGAYGQGGGRASSDDSLDLDFGTNDNQQLPALSNGDSCSDAHSPATSWTDDSLARTSPDLPAYELAPPEWDPFGSAAPPLVSLNLSFFFRTAPLRSHMYPLLLVLTYDSFARSLRRTRSNGPRPAIPLRVALRSSRRRTICIRTDRILFSAAASTKNPSHRSKCRRPI